MASLRVFGDDLDPDELTGLLGRLPSESRRKGDVYRVTRRGRLREADTGYWSYRAQDRAPGALDLQIDQIFRDLTEDIGAWRAVTSRFSCDLYCGLFLRDWSGWSILTPATLGAIAARGVELNLQVYGVIGSGSDQGAYVGNGSDYD